MTPDEVLFVLDYRSSETALTCDEPFFSWGHEEQRACLDGNFTLDELEAICAYMRSRGTNLDGHADR